MVPSTGQRGERDLTRGRLEEDEQSPMISRDDDLQNFKRASSSTLKSSILIAALAVVFFLASAFVLSDWSKYASTGGTAADDDEHSHTHGEEAISSEHVPSEHASAAKRNYLLDPDWDFAAAPTRREYEWTIKDAEYNPDGVYRPMMMINGQFPGPLIEVNEGDAIVVRVHNRATNSTSIHWHGLYQNGTNWMDGTVGVTSCPIAPGRDFSYEFKAEGQSGSYYYHGHHGLQGSDGIYGPLVIHSREERQLQAIDYASDQVVLFSDHYHDLSTVNMMKYLQSDRENVEPVPDGALINGHNVRDCSKLAHRRCDNRTDNVVMPRFDLQQGASHRLRIVNSGAFAEFQISVDEHEFSVTEVDGVDVHPVSYHRLNISPGQRYSIILNTTRSAVAAATTMTTRQSQSQSYWLRAKMVRHCFGEPNPALEPEIWAAVHYISSSSSSSGDDKSRAVDVDDDKPPPQSQDWPEPIELQCRDLNTTELHPVVPMAAPATADATFYLRANFEIGAYRLSRGFFNGSSWRANISHPLLFRALDSGDLLLPSPVEGEEGGRSRRRRDGPPPPQHPHVNGATFDSRRELVIQTRRPAVLDLVISNFDDGYHPFHLHGYKFFVLGQGKGYPPANLTATVDVRNPLRRDTASVEGYGWMVMRVVADNPGAWALHCHVGWHIEAGLLMQLLTNTDQLAQMAVPRAARELCSAPRLQDLQRGATPPDESFYNPDD